MAKSVAGRAGPKGRGKAWRPKLKKPKRPGKGISPIRVVVVLALALTGAVWLGHIVQEYFNEGVIIVSGVKPKVDMPPHPSQEPISFQ